MLQLPYHSSLPIRRLVCCFDNTVATYKYYWFLSILQVVDRDGVVISKRELFARMVANAWYPINYYRLSFGVSDKLAEAIRAIREVEGIAVDAKVEEIVARLVGTTNKETVRLLKHFDKNVPHWFLSCFLGKMTEQMIKEQSRQYEGDCLYALYEGHIELNARWVDYLRDNMELLKSFCYWHLTLFLQQRNPSTPDIPNKLIKPVVRGSLNDQRKYWNVVFNELGRVNCIYTGRALEQSAYVMEHFVPHAFVSHDLIWNLIPADASFNSTKSDRLPPMGVYFDAFYNLQWEAYQIVSRVQPKNKFLEEYLSIFPDSQWDKVKFRDTIAPLITIANRNGFDFLSV